MASKGGIFMSPNRNLKNRTAMSSSIDIELYRKLQEYSKSSGIPISKLLDKAISLLFQSLDV